MKTRILPPEEWEKVQFTRLPELLQYCKPEHVSVVVVESDEEIVACLAVIKTIHLEGAWIHPEHVNAGVVRSLLSRAVEEAGPTSWAFGGAADGHMRDVLERLGGVKVEMDTYALNLEGPCRQQ